MANPLTIKIKDEFMAPKEILDIRNTSPVSVTSLNEVIDIYTPFIKDFIRYEAETLLLGPEHARLFNAYLPFAF